MKQDPQLSQLLLTWKVEPAPSPDFYRAVWSRIEREKKHRASSWLASLQEWFMLNLPKPAYAVALVMIFALSGMGVADLAVSRLERREQATLKERYLTSIDPLAKANESMRRQ